MSNSQETPSQTQVGQTPANPTTPVGANTRNGLGLASLIIGIAAIVLAFVPLVNLGAGAVGLAGLVIGIVALTRKDKPKGQALAGVILSALSMILAVVLAIVYSLTFMSAIGDNLDELETSFEVEELTEVDDLQSEDFDSVDETAPLDAGDETNLPDDFPAEVPVFDGPVTYAMSLGTDTGGHWKVHVRTDDSSLAMQEVRSQLIEAGYVETSWNELDEFVSGVFETDQHRVSVQGSIDIDGEMLMYTVTSAG